MQELRTKDYLGQKFRALRRLAGNTPLLGIHFRFQESEGRVYAKSMGVGRYLRAKNPRIRVHPVEPAESPTLSTGCKIGSHRIQGISDEFIPAIVDLGFLDEVISVSDGDAILMAQKLAANLGLAVGVSSGYFLAAVKLQQQLGSDAMVVTVFPDDNKKYQSTDLLREEACRESRAVEQEVREADSHRSRDRLAR